MEARVAEPMLPLGMLRGRVAAVTLFAGFSLNAGYYGIVFLLSLYLQQVRGDSPLQAGLMFLPMTALTAVVNLASTRIAERFGPQVPVLLGYAVMAAGLLLLLPVSAGTPAWVLLVLLVPVGVGGAFTVPMLTARLLESVEASRAGLMGGLFNTFRQMGGALAVAAFGSLAAGDLRGGMTVSLLCATGLLLVTAVLILALPAARRPGTRPGTTVPGRVGAVTGGTARRGS